MSVLPSWYPVGPEQRDKFNEMVRKTIEDGRKRVDIAKASMEADEGPLDKIAKIVSTVGIAGVLIVGGIVVIKVIGVFD